MHVEAAALLHDRFHRLSIPEAAATPQVIKELPCVLTRLMPGATNGDTCRRRGSVCRTGLIGAEAMVSTSSGNIRQAVYTTSLARAYFHHR
jgi:hypothetical protein